MASDTASEATDIYEFTFKTLQFYVEKAIRTDEIRALKGTRMDVIEDVAQGLVMRLSALMLGKAMNERRVVWPKPGIKNGMRIRWKWARKLFGPIEYENETVTQYRICPHVAVPEKDPRHFSYIADGNVSGLMESIALKREEEARNAGAAAGWTAAMEKVQDLITRGIEMNTHGSMVKFDRTNPLLNALGIDIRRLKMKSDWQRFFERMNKSKQATADHGYREGFACGYAKALGDIDVHCDTLKGYPIGGPSAVDLVEKHVEYLREMAEDHADVIVHAFRDEGWEQFRQWLLAQLERGFGDHRVQLSVHNNEAVRRLQRFAKGHNRPHK